MKIKFIVILALCTLVAKAESFISDEESLAESPAPGSPSPMKSITDPEM